MVGNAPFCASSASATSLAVDPTTSSIIVAYRDGGYGGKLSVSRVDAGGGGGWALLGRRGWSEASVYRTRAVVTKSGSLYVAYEIGANVDEADGVSVFKWG